jgi:hypothetical protein
MSFADRWILVAGITRSRTTMEVTTVSKARSRRLRLLESLRRTMSDKLHEKVCSSSVSASGFGVPENTSAIYRQAQRIAPELLDQLLNVHARTCEEQGHPQRPAGPMDGNDIERKQMLSAVRAAVMRSQTRFG